MNKDLMLAVLAMNAYDETINAIGTAQFRPTDLPIGSADAGFFAKAYTYNGETIISYRGTDGGWAAANDILNGWGGGAGYAPTQASLAAEFYRAVIGANASPYSGNVTFTGHSLGGGLAGLMAGLYGKDAVVFDNMAYSGAINDVYGNAIRPYNIDLNTGLVIPGEENPFHQRALDDFYSNVSPFAPNTTGISGWQLQGQILQGSQSSGTAVGGSIDWGVGSIDLHSQALLVLTMYAEQQTGLDPVWKDVAEYFGQELFAQGAVTDIAYSVVSEGVRPKGDAAAHSMFDDAADVANFIVTEGSSYLFYNSIEPAWDLAEIAVRFAKRQADTAVTVSSMGNEGGGIFHATEAGLFLSLDSTAKAWGDIASISGWESIKSLTLYGLQVENREALSPETISVMNEVDFVLFSAGRTVDVSLDGENPMVFAGQIENAQTAAGLVFGTDDIDVIKGGKGDDFLIGGGGADTLIGGAGGDALFGGEGADILVSGDPRSVQGASQNATSENVDGGIGTDYMVLTADSRILNNVESKPDVILQGGDKADRLLVTEGVLFSDGAPISEGEDVPLYARRRLWLRCVRPTHHRSQSRRESEL